MLLLYIRLSFSELVAVAANDVAENTVVIRTAEAAEQGR